jgi:acetylornithine deacetylase/succinyl-diaminopimelate desuccinylase family protein
MRDLVDVDRLIDSTGVLVAADSQNPPGRERAAVDVARRLLTDLGASSITEVEPEPGRPSLVAHVPGRRAGDDRARPTLIVNGHLDTVPFDAAAWTHDPLGCELADGRLYGRGTADMKGGIAAAIEAVRVARTATGGDGGLPCDVVFHLVADEETGGQKGTKVLLDRGLITGDACIDPEPTSMQVSIAERGLLQAAIAITGVPAHASEPHRGDSAIEHAARMVLALQGADYGEEHPLLGRPSSNVGIIEGGSGINVVAPTCTLKVDRRVLPGASADATLDTIRQKVDDADPAARYELATLVFGEASELARDDPFLARFQRAYDDALGRPADIIGLQATTDARFVRNQAGIPALVCGPGDLDQAHRVDEWVSVDALVDATVVYAHLLLSYGV